MIAVALICGACACSSLPLASTSPAARTSPRPAGTSSPPAPAASPTPDPALIAAMQITNSAAPVRLLVPAIGVQADVEAVGLDAQGNMGTPSLAANVAWYKPGVAPGDSGNAVIAGHLDWYTSGGSGVGPAVFWYLAKLKRGDQVTVVRADGSQAVFQVDSTGTMPFNSSTDGLFMRGGAPTLSLVTCAGAWDKARATYTQRLVVRAVLTAITPSAG